MRAFEFWHPMLHAGKEHGGSRILFGLDGETVLYFSTIPEMVEKAKYLVNNAPNGRGSRRGLIPALLRVDILRPKDSQHTSSDGSGVGGSVAKSCHQAMKCRRI
jgi:hypothetical protein